MGAVAKRHDQGQISFERTNDSTLVVQVSGPRHLQRDLPPVSLLLSELASRPGTKRLSFETAQLTHWGRANRVSYQYYRHLSCTWHRRRPRGASGRLAAPARTGRGGSRKKSARSETARISLFERVGNMTLGYGLRRVIELNQHRDSASTDSNAASASRRYAELIKTCSL
jgi:hypothetical protein